MTATDRYGRSVDSPIYDFTVSYTQPSIQIVPAVTQNAELGSVVVLWGETVAIVGTETGTIQYENDFLYAGDKALSLPSNSDTVEWSVDVDVEFTMEMTIELPSGFTGTFIEFDSGDYYAEYDGTKFILHINTFSYDILETTITGKKWLLGLRPTSMYIREV